ncbi:MAG: hypothetical protein RJA22_21 [Verrucomicrobiota bacterium]|jgi:hypothetical protein
MLKTIKDGRLWLVTQPDHGQVAGYLAAHWGGHGGFTRPGHFGGADPERLRAETIFAIAQHDNGWWEWEAAPDLSAEDGMPLGLAEVLQDQAAGRSRWRNGLSRFKDAAYANLLMSRHAYWLYALRALPDPDPAFTHPLFWKGSPEKLYPGSQEEPLKFIAELEQLQAQWTQALRADRKTATWVDPENLQPHERLIQLCDGLSLALSSAVIQARTGETRGLGADAFALHDVPRSGWQDRVTIEVTPRGQGRIELDPYPFDLDPLPVLVPARVIPLPAAKPEHFQTWWQSLLPQKIEFQLMSRR